MDAMTALVKKGLTFETSKGRLLPQDLYKMPLTSRTGFDLDHVSRDLLATMRTTAEESLVVTPTKANEEDELRLEVLKIIIADKKAEETARKDAQAKKAKIERLDALIASKQDEVDHNKSLEELLAERNAL